RAHREIGPSSRTRQTPTFRCSSSPTAPSRRSRRPTAPSSLRSAAASSCCLPTLHAQSRHRPVGCSVYRPALLRRLSCPPALPEGNFQLGLFALVYFRIPEGNSGTVCS
ncbi:hypothetical protein HK102_012272, partial [Quaeritorhiza haematococci]